MKVKLFNSFRTKITLALVLSMLFIGALNDFIIYRFSINTQFNDLKSKLSIIAQTSALVIDADILMSIPLDKEAVNSPQFKLMEAKLKKIQQVNPLIKYIYTMTYTDKPGIWQFIIDLAAPGKSKDVDRIAYPGEKYNVSRFPDMMMAFNSPSVDKEIERDEWGYALSGYAPIRNSSGKAVAVLGIDVSADDIYIMQRELMIRALLVLFLGVLLSVLIGMVISRKISGPVKKLAQGAQAIGSGDLEYRIDLKSKDELALLAESFNQMARDLSDSRKKLVNYFYRVVQSLVKALEARDPYTMGHSERVSEYSVKIAVEMGLPEKDVELLREATLLHDIGKFGVKENVLNKNASLNQEEYEMILHHPVIGDEIMRPVVPDQEIINIIRGHHERYDGTGYPDGKKGNEIDILTAITSVADSYDAMTSKRTYNNPMDKDTAINEIKKKSGTQFNPEVVDAFIRAMNK